MPATSLPEFRSPRSLISSGKSTIPQVFEWHAQNNPNYPFYRFHDGNKLNVITYARVAEGMRRAARYIKSRVDTPQSIAILANADTITYSLTSMGILRAGYTMFLISPRNVPAAVVDLLRRTGCRQMLISADAPIQQLAQTALYDIDGVSLHPMPVYDDLYPKDAPIDDEVEPSDLPREYDMNTSAMILHSSGSTNHPKPIRWTHKRMARWSTTPWYGEVDLSQASLSIHGTPMFHAIGVMMWCIAANNGMPIGVFPPASLPTVPTPENVFEGIIQTYCEYVITAPAVIEAWARDPQKVQHMKTMKALIFGGAPLSQEVGDALAAYGITLWSCYGCTEVGASARFFPANMGTDWAYFELNPMYQIVLLNAGEDKYELVVLSSPEDPLPVVNTKIDGIDAYATNDLLVKHPTREGLWKYYGRLDDQIILSNGEKTNPTPLEDIINEDPMIQASVMFGQGKFQNGVLVEPAPTYRFDPKDIIMLQEYRNQIWPTIERANGVAPQHSRIFKEMIMVSSPSKPFTYNIKGYPRRPTILKDYHDDIEDLYKQLEQTAQSDVQAPTVWDYASVHRFLCTVIEKVLGKPLTSDADLFRNGCDSLQATWIRNTILRAIRENSPAAAQRVPMSIVFQAPSISALTEALLCTMQDPSTTTGARRAAEDLVRMVERYTAELPMRPSQLRSHESVTDVVLITGTTGGFGCDVLEHLLQDERVTMVYAFNRLGTQALERQRARFRERGLEEVLLSSPKFRMVEATLDVPGFGIVPELLEEIRSSLTHIIHNAWTVNFSLTLPSFEPDLKAVRNLVELSLSSPFIVPPKIQLVSSIGIFENCAVDPPVPEVPIEPSSALGTGYSESKWIAEQVLYTAADRAGIPAVVVRLGQVSGDKTGHWNEREWFPALVKSAVFTRCLPDVDGSVSFVLGYEAARAFVEMRDSSAPIVHLVHPRPVPWHTLISTVAEELQVPLVSYTSWLEALEKTARNSQGSGEDLEALRENPALRLLDFFRSRKSEQRGKEPLGLAYLSTEKAQSASRTLAGMPQLGENEARRWVAAWRASGFIEARR